MILVVRRKAGPIPVEVLVPKSPKFFGPRSERPFVAEAPHVELEHGEAPRKGFVGDVHAQVLGIFRDAGARVFADDELVGVSAERRVL